MPSRYKGFWERYLWSLLLLRPYRCLRCAYRFFYFGLYNGVNDVKRAKWRRGQEKQFSQFFKAPDQKVFQELIQQMTQTEKLSLSAQGNPSQSATSAQQSFTRLTK